MLQRNTTGKNIYIYIHMYACCKNCKQPAINRIRSFDLIKNDQQFYMYLHINVNFIKSIKIRHAWFSANEETVEEVS